ncbi:hypothetical protein HMPREF9080_02633 [Cardiobacterium valvarum F0432]|uniref:Uncharacterized protein n=1 Tax=Cardiobacterium valvarum F0432 TaxID=797473 RepID=G9ZIM2_9GAMM|nr:hypothetical protein HMPREF9080_02633 [Cardiobacterium valvarum F0432]
MFYRKITLSKKGFELVLGIEVICRNHGLFTLTIPMNTNFSFQTCLLCLKGG